MPDHVQNTDVTDNHTQAYIQLKMAVDLWWNGNITRLELIVKVATILAHHEQMEGAIETQNHPYHTARSHSNVAIRHLPRASRTGGRTQALSRKGRPTSPSLLPRG